MLDRSRIGLELPVGHAVIERGGIRLFARAIGATDPVYTSVAVARARGFPDIPIPPTYLYTLELEREPAIDFLGVLGASMGHLLHGEQSLKLTRHLCAGEHVSFHTRIADIFTKGARQHEFFILHTRVQDANDLVVGELCATFVVPH